MTVLSAATLAEALAGLVQQTEAAGLEAAGFHEEAHFQAGLWAWARNLRPRVSPVAEAKYAGRRWTERCDLLLHQGARRVAWIEMKKIWHGTGEHWQTKPSEQVRKLLWDVAKVVRQIKDDGREGYIAVVAYNLLDHPFAVEAGRSAGTDARATVRALRDWMDGRISWPDVQAAFALPQRLSGEHLLAQVRRCLGLVAELCEVPLPPSRGIEYRVIVGRVLPPPRRATRRASR